MTDPPSHPCSLCHIAQSAFWFTSGRYCYLCVDQAPEIINRKHPTTSTKT